MPPYVPGFQRDAMKFLFYTLNILLTSLAGTSVALVMSASVHVYSIGAVLTSLVWVFMMIFSGLLINLDTLAVGLRWLQYLSIFRYSMSVSIYVYSIHTVPWYILI